MINTAAVLSFFTGKSLTNAIEAMALVEQSIAQGFWVKGASRSVRSVMAKANVAAKAAKKAGESGGYGFQRDRTAADPRRAFFKAYMLLAYGALDFAELTETMEVSALIETDHPAFTAFFRSYAVAMLPLAEAMAKLDATRPPPVFTEMKASPTVSRTLAGLKAEAVAVCPMTIESLQRVNNETGKSETVFVTKLLWPEGTKHNTSRYTGSCSCQACGHTIFRGDNWMPLVLTTAEGPKSLWVGRDCAKTLFGVDYSGTLEIAGGREA